MNYSKKSTAAKQKQLTSSNRRMISKMRVMTFRIIIVLFVTVVACGIMAGFGILRGIIDTAPNIDSIDVSPEGYSTKIYDAQGNITQTLIGQNANRVYVSLEQIPEIVQNAFIAIEDSRFREHDGIDIKGIIRAAQNTLATGKLNQGASTITQQLLKNTIFDGGSESSDLAKIQRKVQEQYLAIQLEDRIDKDTILEYYLNTINLGQNTLGVQAASLRYFGKTVTELNLSEASVIAGITQNPSQYNPITHPEDNKAKRSIVLDYMREQGYIDEAQYNEAIADNVYERIAEHNEGYSSAQDSAAVSSYFNDALFEQVMNDLKEDLGYTETQAYNALYRGGLSIHSTQDKDLQKICDETLNDPSFYPANTEFQLSYQLTVRNADGTDSNYSEQTMKKWINKKDPSFDIYFTDKKAAKSYIKKYKKHILKKGGDAIAENINYILQPQISFVLMDQHTGEVSALVGGRGKKIASRTLNRATKSLRQPGSTFKILSTYLPAFDTAGMTLSTTQVDEKYYYPGTNKEVRNWNGEHYRGTTTLRQGIINSMNVVTVKTLEQVTPKVAYDYLLNLGFTTLVDSRTENGKVYSDIQLPMALGGLTDGVTNLELTAAYASIANNGIYTEPVLYTKILDHDGNVLLEKKPSTRRVFKDTTAYMLTSAMKDVITQGTGKLAKFSEIDMPQAGKTGTTSNDIDLWFEGYTPYYTAGIWGGWDLNKDQEDTSYHKILWKTVMEKVHKFKELPKTQFDVPESLNKVSVCAYCGKLATEACSYSNAVKKEYYVEGDAPTSYCSCHSYKPSDEDDDEEDEDDNKKKNDKKNKKDTTEETTDNNDDSQTPVEQVPDENSSQADTKPTGPDNVEAQVALPNPEENVTQEEPPADSPENQ